MSEKYFTIHIQTGIYFIITLVCTAYLSHFSALCPLGCRRIHFLRIMTLSEKTWITSYHIIPKGNVNMEKTMKTQMPTYQILTSFITEFPLLI